MSYSFTVFYKYTFYLCIRHLLITPFYFRLIGFLSPKNLHKETVFCVINKEN